MTPHRLFTKKAFHNIIPVGIIFIIQLHTNRLKIIIFMSRYNKLNTKQNYEPYAKSNE